MDELQYLEKYLKYKEKYHQLKMIEGGLFKNLPKSPINLPKSPFNRNGPSSPLAKGVEQSQKIVDRNVSSNIKENQKKLNLDLKTSLKKFEPSDVMDKTVFEGLVVSGTFGKNGKLNEQKAIRHIVGSTLVFVSQQLLDMIKMFYQDDEIKKIIMDKDLSEEDRTLLNGLNIPKLYKIALGFIVHCYNLQMYTENGLEQDGNTYKMKSGKEGKTNYNNLKSELESLIDGIIVEETGKQIRKKGQITVFDNNTDSFEYYSQDMLKQNIENLLKKLQEYKNKDYEKVSDTIKKFLETFKNIETLSIDIDGVKKNIHSLKTISELKTFLTQIKSIMDNDSSQKLLELTDYQNKNKFSPKIKVFETTINSFINLVRCSVSLGSMKFADLYDQQQKYFLPGLDKIKAIYTEATQIDKEIKGLLSHDNMKLTPEQENLVKDLQQQLEMAGSDKVGIFNRLLNSKLKLKDLFKRESIEPEYQFEDLENADNVFDEESLKVFQEGKQQRKLTKSMINRILNSTNKNMIAVGVWLDNIVNKNKSPKLEVKEETTSPIIRDIATGDQFSMTGTQV